MSSEESSALLDHRRARPDPTEIAEASTVGASARTPFTFAVARALGTVVVTARGALDPAGSRVLKAVLSDLIDDQGNLAVVVDLDGVTDIDRGCLDVFVVAHGWAISRGGQLSLAGAHHQVARALEAAGVARLVRVTEDRILALPARPPGSRAAGLAG